MTAIPDFDAVRVFGGRRKEAPARPEAAVVETFWGYRITALRAPLWLIAVQGLCWIVGVVLVIAAIGMWAVPGTGEAAGVALFKLGASVPMAAVAALLLWHSSRGSAMGVEIDLRLGEVREVLANRAGRTTVLSRYGFDAIGGVHLDRGAGRAGEAALVLRYRNTAQVLRVAEGPEARLLALRDRMGRDLMLPGRARKDGAATEVARPAMAEAA